ncbi:hypothetical protein HMPREF0083_00158 [Aneurinibacillus aneurinilyticus ATCC 12856]|uniref:Uncharacterized protein n=1 Tax=Aneurinibacillus aneurinilyticus ATCC 12856 TaxID=649747 RepID=U1YLR6_ANEAE|nr:hypothetical protein HMPREF0083_00158 [Aneurinibacillus aneurinilyticus ATCC 12856]
MGNSAIMPSFRFVPQGLRDLGLDAGVVNRYQVTKKNTLV